MSEQKRNQKRNQNGCVYHGISQKLTKAEAEICTYLEIEGLTVAQVASRRHCSKQFVRKVRKKLQNSGLFSAIVGAQPKRGGDSATSATKKVRLHAQKFTISLNLPGRKYLECHVGKVFSVDSNDVQCFEGEICVQAKDKEFWGETEELALAESLKYWWGFFRILENDLHVIILKNRKQNIEMSYAEWATAPSGLSEECENRNDRIRLFADDGKLRFTTDWSDLQEHEAHHYRKGLKDSKTANRFIADILDSPEAPTFTQLCKVVGALAETNTESAMGLKAVIELLRPEKPKVEPEKDLKKGGERPFYVG